MSHDPWGGGSDRDPKLRLKEQAERERRERERHGRPHGRTPWDESKWVRLPGTGDPQKTGKRVVIPRLDWMTVLVWVAILGSMSLVFAALA